MRHSVVSPVLLNGKFAVYRILWLLFVFSAGLQLTTPASTGSMLSYFQCHLLVLQLTQEKWLFFLSLYMREKAILFYTARRFDLITFEEGNDGKCKNNNKHRNNFITSAMSTISPPN